MISMTVLDKADSDFLSLFITTHAQNKQIALVEIRKVKVRLLNSFFDDTCSSDHVTS